MDHGAVVLVTGETLLVGGANAKTGQGVLDSMEAIDPATRLVRSVDVAALQVARRAPTVLRLASGEILVAGGFDAAGTPVPTIRVVLRRRPTRDQERSRSRGRLGPRVRRARRRGGPGGGRRTSGAPPGFQNVWVIDADGAFEAATPLAGSLTQPLLFDGARAAPRCCWTGDRWLRWQPWQGAFGALGELDAAAAHPSAATASPDPGLALWLDDAAAPTLTALRFDTRGEYSPLEGPLLVGTASDVAPDCLAAPGVDFFDASSGLELGPGASAFVTDRTYAAVSVDLDAPTGEPALVVLRDELGAELEVGGVACAGALAKGGSASSLHVERTGATVRWAIAGGAQGVCPSGVRSDARLSVGVRAPGGMSRSVAHNLRVRRLGP